MSDRDVLYEYRRNEAITTLLEAQKMLEMNFSARSIINRAYYSMFYMVLALFLNKDVQIATSKHSGIMSLFDKEFILTGILDKNHSRSFHKMFDSRMEFDYKDYSDPSSEDAHEAVASARLFISSIADLCGTPYIPDTEA